MSDGRLGIPANGAWALRAWHELDAIFSGADTAADTSHIQSRAILVGKQALESGEKSLIAGSLLLFIYIAGFIRQSSIRSPNPWRNLVATLQPAYKDGDIVVFDVLYGQVPFDFAAQQVGFKAREDGFPETIYHWWERQPVKVWGGPVLRESDLEATTKRVVDASTTKTVWLVLFEVNYYDPHDRLLARFQ